MMINDKVSIIVPVYNAEKYLEQCINSVLKQTYTNWELLLIDDGSTDNSVKICKKFSRKDERIIIIKQKHKGIPGAVRNVGIKKSTGKYIMFLDSDDDLHVNILLKMLIFQIFQGADLIICNFIKWKKYENLQLVEERNDKEYCPNRSLLNLNLVDIQKYALETLKQQNRNILFNFCWGKLYRADLIKNYNILFNENLYTYEDIEFNFKYLYFVHNVIYMKDILYNYTIHNSTTFNTNIDKFFNYIDALYSMRSFFKSYVKKRKLRQMIGNAIVSMTVVQLIRSCVNITDKNEQEMIWFYNTVINNPDVRRSLKFYRPNKGESWLIPLFIFLKQSNLLFIILKYKARKRYKS